MSLSDELLMAYVDGELSADDRARVEAEMRADATVARRIEQQQAMRAKLRAAFDGVLSEPVPERLLATARGATSDAQQNAGSATIADFSAAAAQRDAKREARATRRWSWPEWSAMAASLVVGVIIARFSMSSGEGGPFVSRQGQLLAQGGLADALSNQLASTQSREAATQIGVSFRAKDGRYCRSFTTRDDGAVAGLACREGEAWHIDVLALSDAVSGEYQQAGTALPPAILSAVEQQIDGEPLDAAMEAQAQESGWKGDTAR